MTSGIDFTQSLKLAQEITADREDRERQIRELQQENKKLQQLKEECDEQIRDLQQQLQKNFKAWQQVSSYPVSPEKCYATGKGLKVAVVGEHTTAVLHTVDEEGQEYDKSLENM